MKRVLVVPFLALMGAVALGQVAQAQKPRVIEIEVGDTMKFSVEAIEAKPGETLLVRLVSNGTMPKVAMGHNFVLLKPTANPLEVSNAGLEHRDTDFIAPQMKEQILASTKLIGPGENAEVTFKAPAKPGSYTYLCTFPGHFAGGMKGTLTVK